MLRITLVAMLLVLGLAPSVAADCAFVLWDFIKWDNVPGAEYKPLRTVASLEECEQTRDDFYAKGRDKSLAGARRVFVCFPGGIDPRDKR